MVFRSHPLLAVLALLVLVAVNSQPTTRVIVGDVLAHDGQGVAGARVILKAGSDLVEATTDENGHFVIHLRTRWSGEARYTVMVDGEAHLFNGTEIDHDHAVFHTTLRL